MARVEKDVAVFVFLDPHAEVVEQLDEEIAQKRIGISRPHPRQHRLGRRRIEGVELEQPVAPFLHFQREG